ncbi:MAG: hypothetical protein B6227_04280 [Fusobacteriia bacterium 4572_74]|nr:MAG: hypothetical protein B6227_04280 [Fusobacteriia bacterium 4572_74]
MHKELGTKKILPLLIKFSIPSTIAILITMIYNITDRYFIGQYVGRDGLMSLIILTYTTPILEFLGATGNNINEAYIYNQYLIPFIIFQVAFISLNAFIRVEGNPMLSVKINLFGAGLNILLDYIFIAQNLKLRSKK